MKIIAVGRNYADHAKELQNELPTEPIIFLKPDTAILRNNEPFYYPEFSQDVHYEVELLIKINKEGKYIAEKNAANYYSEIGLGIDFTARDLQAKLKAKGLPWELSKSFNGSAVIGKFYDKESLPALENIEFSLTKNGSLVQSGIGSQMIFSVDAIIAFVSQYITLRAGDIIFTGTPQGVGPISIGDQLTGYIGEIEAFNFSVK